MPYVEKINHAACYIQDNAGKIQAGTPAVVLGTGLGGVADLLGDGPVLPYADIPGFPRSTVPGHTGALRVGSIGGRTVLALCGRFHLYEGYTAPEVAFGVRVLGVLGAGPLVLTNAAGALNPQFRTGDLMAIADHINLSGASPLTGPNNDAWGERFPDMSRVWDLDLLDLARSAALGLGIRLERGVYIQVPGPNMETPAETRAYRMLGADAIGMSTVIEAIAAHHMGLRLLGLSCLTNKNLPDCMVPASLDDVLAGAARAGANLRPLLEAILAGM